MAESENVGDERNKQRARKLDDIARRTRELDSHQPLGGHADDVALIEPDEDAIAFAYVPSGPRQETPAYEQAAEPTTELNLASVRSDPNEFGNDAGSDVEAEAERADGWFDPLEALASPGSCKWDKDFNPPSWAPEPLEDPTPIDANDDFAFTVLANELAATVRMLQQPSSRFRCIKAKLTKASLVLSAFDGGCFAEGTLELVNDPIGIGAEAVVFLFSAPELEAACSASGLTVHLRVSYALKRAWFKSGGFERPLVLQSKRTYLDRTVNLFGSMDDQTHEDVDATAMLVASTRLSTILKLHEDQKDLDFIAFEDRASSCKSSKAFGFVNHNLLPARRLIVLAKHVALLQDVLPNASSLVRHTTSKYEVFRNHQIKFGFEKAARDGRTLAPRKQWLENCSTVRMPRPHLIRFLEANHVAKGKTFRLRADQEGACTIDLVGDPSNGRQVCMHIDGRFESINAGPLDELVLTSPLLEIIAQAKTEQQNIELKIKQDYVGVALTDIHEMETTYIIALPRRKDRSDAIKSIVAYDDGNTNDEHASEI